MSAAIELKDLTKRYGRAKALAVDGISLEIKAGEVYGFLGANGAGKSTTIRTIMDFIRPTSGTIRLMGQDTSGHGASIRKHVGYLAGDVVLPKNITGDKLLQYLARLNGGVDQAYLRQLIQRFEAQVDKRTETLSKGNRQKIGLIQAFMHKPDILILDEPTSGLDPLMQEQFHKTIHESRERGAAVFLSSHSFDEAERICDRVGIVRRGKLVYEGPVTEILAAHVPRWRVVLKNKADIGKLHDVPTLKILSHNGPALVLEPTGAIEKALLALSRVGIASITSDQNELEDEFLRYYGEDTEARS